MFVVTGTKARGLVTPTPVINTNNMNGHGEPKTSENIPPTPTTPTAAMVHTRQTIAGYAQQSSMPSNVTVLGTQQQQLGMRIVYNVVENKLKFIFSFLFVCFVFLYTKELKCTKNEFLKKIMTIKQTHTPFYLYVINKKDYF